VFGGAGEQQVCQFARVYTSVYLRAYVLVGLWACVLVCMLALSGPHAGDLRTCICTTMATYSKRKVERMRRPRTKGKSGFNSLPFDCNPFEWDPIFTPAANRMFVPTP